MVIISARAIATLGVPDPTVIRKSGIFLPGTFVRLSRYAIMMHIIIPNDAAHTDVIMLLPVDERIELREKMVSQYFKVKLPSSNTDLPILTVNEVANTDMNGITMTTTANRPTSMVSGSLHFPRSTILGRTDLPEIIM